MTEISVIIPTYNCEKYISECLDSIVNQTLGIENIEVIIVDDASTDNTVSIIEGYVNEYPDSFKLIRQEVNQGSGPARNIGLKNITSDYFTFIDSDDFISLDAYEKGLEIFKNDAELDLLIFPYMELRNGKTVESNDLSSRALKESKTIRDLNDCPEIIFSTFAHIKIYSRDLIKYMIFPPLHSHQDNFPSANVMVNSRKIRVTTDFHSYYRVRSDSMSHAYNHKIALNLLKASKQILDLRQDHSQYFDVLSFLALKLVYHVVHYLCKRPGFELSEGEKVYPHLKKFPQYFSHDIIEKYQQNFPNQLPCSEQCLWDLNEMDYYEYILKNRCSNTIANLNKQNDSLIGKNNELNSNIKKLTKKNKKLNKKLDKQKELKKELKKKNKKLNKQLLKQKHVNEKILNSKSWKLTSFLRKFKNFFK